MDSCCRRLAPLGAALSLLALNASPAAAQTPSGGWGLREENFSALVLFVFFSIVILVSIHMARSGRPLYVRRIAGLNAIEEAVGRATELGRKVLYVPGIMSIDEMQTLASLAVLKHVAKHDGRVRHAARRAQQGPAHLSPPPARR